MQLCGLRVHLHFCSQCVGCSLRGHALQSISVCRAEERKRKLREAAQASAETGMDQKVFTDSEYMVGEDARTPNVHSRQVCSHTLRTCI